jgi:ribonuclease HI
MTRKRFYAVKVGHKTGVFLTWQECYFALKDYSGPCFKIFYSLEEARAFLNEPCPNQKRTLHAPNVSKDKC